MRGMRYDTPIRFNEKYKDRLTGVEGFPVGISFFEHGCERVSLEWLQDRGMHSWVFDAERLEPQETPPGGTSFSSQVALGEKYIDTATRVEGVAVSVSFFPNASERVTLKYKDRDNNVTEETFDAPELMVLKKKTSLLGGEKVTTEKIEVDKPGGPDRGTSHVRREPMRR